MPSRMKAKGKARKVAKAKKEAEGGREDEMSSLQAGMEELWAMKNPGNNDCTHGSAPLDQSAEKFLRDFCTVYQRGLRSSSNSGKLDVGKELGEAHVATIKEYAGVWTDSAAMELVQSTLVAKGAQHILHLGEESEFTRCCASMAYYFEQYTAVVLKGDAALPDTVKVAELFFADKHTLVKFFKKRIPCSCLDHVYKEVKSSTKMGLCCNNQCSHPSKQVARNTMLYCTRCRQVNYCSRECQIAHWPEHKEFCGYCVSTKDEIDSKRKS